METRKKHYSKRKKHSARQDQPVMTKLELFKIALEKKLLSPDLLDKEPRSLHDINQSYGVSNEDLYATAVISMARLVSSLDVDILKILISDVEKLQCSVNKFFQDSFERVRLESTPLPNQVQWLANCARFLLFKEDKSPRYPDLEADDFKQFIGYAKENYDSEDLPLSLRARFGLLIAYAYIIPTFKDIDCNHFEINPRATRLPIKLLPKNMHRDHDKYRLDMYFFWLKKVIALAGDHKLDTQNLRADCKDLVFKFNLYFLPSLTRQAFFSAMVSYQSIVYPSAPDILLEDVKRTFRG